jgi:hypothetical protein
VCAKVVTLPRLQPGANAQAAEWVIAGLRGFGESVLSLVPAGFAAYVRIFHPARRQPPGSSELTPVNWHEIAAANGREAHAGMQLAGLTGTLASNEVGQPGVFDHPPAVGSLPTEQVVALARVLARHTATPDRCWFAIWEGFGDLHHEVRSAPTFSAPHREYHLLTGPVDPLVGYDSLREQSPNLCWPEDRSWCLASEIDLNSSYLGCDRACADEILVLAELEARTIDPQTGIDFASDAINPVESPSA